ncbi:hydrogenase 4 subunit B [Candidatus Magnetomonas plexicatena]|uniref:hydrogenase 4 subunit B n=1 Tax=Candidatus Magnetomonas plexicatena TaxID=2552947 RepID=UPI001C747DF9|nr:hydrogenase 4 subunit B [Nitrospirales bacterium LBB_01]
MIKPLAFCLTKKPRYSSARLNEKLAMDFTMISPIKLSILSIAAFIIPVIFAIVIGGSRRLTIYISFSVSALASLSCAIAGLWALSNGITQQLTLPIGLPALPFHLRLDQLSGFFMVIIGLLSFYVSIYSMGYVGGLSRELPTRRLIVFYNLFVAAMFVVVLADDALCFLVAWEVMAGASYFLVMFEDGRSESRRAAYLYMVMAHVGAVLILLSFGVMAGVSTGFENFTGYTFDAMRAMDFPVKWATAAFLLYFIGFSAKAGVIPLHVWLPEAHPVAPSNVSALMSGVMLKIAIYGIVRFTFDIIRVYPWWWGALVLVLGLISAVMGVLFALMQHDIKKLLAYSSVENVGIILIGIGLSMIFTSFHLPVMASLALVAGLYHTMNHAMFKGLLFMGAGAIVHAVHDRKMDNMGGLIRRLPWTSVLFLVGSISISGLPPFNGFVSEWLTFQALLLSPSLPNQLMKLLIPLGAALLALTAALASATFVKTFGVIFLGNNRGANQHEVTESGWAMRIAMMLAAFTCLCFGILPTIVIDWMDVITERLFGTKLNTTSGVYGWMWLTPVDPERASYSGPLVLIGIIVVCSITYLLLHVRAGNIRRAPVWDCGFQKLNHKMQYNAISFSMPIRRIFGFLFKIKEQIRVSPQQRHPAFPVKSNYYLRIRDRFWGWIYRPIVDIVFLLSRKASLLQHGRIHLYLIYSFVTIIVLLAML